MAKTKPTKQDMTHLGKFTGFQTEKDAKLHRIWTNTCNKERPDLKILLQKCSFFLSGNSENENSHLSPPFIHKLASCKCLQFWSPHKTLPDALFRRRIYYYLCDILVLLQQRQDLTHQKMIVYSSVMYLQQPVLVYLEETGISCKMVGLSSKTILLICEAVFSFHCQMASCKHFSYV